MQRIETISVECPACGRPTRNEIPRYTGAVAYLHERSGDHADCRILVLPHPATFAHETKLVPEAQEMWAYLEHVLSTDLHWADRHRRLRALGLMEAVA